MRKKIKALRVLLTTARQSLKAVKLAQLQKEFDLLGEGYSIHVINDQVTIAFGSETYSYCKRSKSAAWLMTCYLQKAIK